MLRLAGIDLNLLVVLDALLMESSVSGAARRIGLSQSATSHALARLRALLDDPILVRTSRGMVPTKRAQSLTARVRTILDESQTLFSEGQELDPASNEDTYRLALDESAQSTLLPILVERLRREAPGVSLVVPSGTQPPDVLLRNLESGLVDAAITSYLPTSARLVRNQFLISTDFVTITQRGVVGARLTLKRFLELGHITTTHPMLADSTIDSVLASRSTKRRVVLALPAPGSIASIVSRSHLAATIPRMLVDLGGAPRNLMKHQPPIRLDPVSVFLLFHERAEGSSSQRWLRSHITAIFDELKH